jgi:hypothetical protein
MFFAARLGWGAAGEGVQGLRRSDRPDGRCPGPVDAVRSCHGRCPRTTGALVPVLSRPGVLDVAATTGLRRLRRGVCQLGPRVVRAPDPWTYDWDHTWAGKLLGRRGTCAFRCSSTLL